jgi:tryptophan-rich sensory protein
METASRGAANVLALVLLLLASFAAGAIGSAFTLDALPTWYAGLRKPAWNPPNWIFGPVWTTLYVLMGVAAWRVWRGLGLAPLPMGLFAVQLALNTAWSWLFFGLRNPALAFVGIVLLWAAIAATAIVFGRHDRVAGWLFLPYLAWVTFATVLNGAIWRLNP